MDEEERQFEEYMDEIISRAMAENPSLGEPSPGMMWVLRLTARSSKGLPREPGAGPSPPADEAECNKWMSELLRQAKANHDEAEALEEFKKRKFGPFH